MTKWTKGPWRHGNGEYHGNQVFGPVEDAIAMCYGVPMNCRRTELVGEGRWSEGLANAALISAAPELYEALADLVDACDGNYSELTEGCQRVLAKARGESND